MEDVVLPTIRVRATKRKPPLYTESSKKHWFGQTREDAMSAYRAVISHGYALKCNYGVTISPYLESGILASIVRETATSSFLSRNPYSKEIIDDIPAVPIWLLATEVDCPVMTGETESAKVGHGNIVRMTGTSGFEIPVTFLETANADILKGLKAMQTAQFNADGTQNPPAEYAVWLRITMFDRYEIDAEIWSSQFLVALQSIGNIGLSASDHTPLTTTATFVQLTPYRR